MNRFEKIELAICLILKEGYENGVSKHEICILCKVFGRASDYAFGVYKTQLLKALSICKKIQRARVINFFIYYDDYKYLMNAVTPMLNTLQRNEYKLKNFIY